MINLPGGIMAYSVPDSAEIYIEETKVAYVREGQLIDVDAILHTEFPKLPKP